ncbi:hypothetical protein Y1Q_0007273 [Alligator mississippiensis]|uniref:Uncharacterized protein n=1 Tax=Alligator mississippiensis TaxID=8496 RepID=A0A151NN70_ALLMI|nr:hypothetical protein Y1Q_0007273 [Alligator mississippiensis]
MLAVSLPGLPAAQLPGLQCARFKNAERLQMFSSCLWLLKAPCFPASCKCLTSFSIQVLESPAMRCWMMMSSPPVHVFSSWFCPLYLIVHWA